MTDHLKIPAGSGDASDPRSADTAAYWDKHRAAIRGLFHPVTEALIDEAGIAPGQSVLDVATGSGEPALSIAPVVGPTGSVFGIDPSPTMTAAAERAAIERHLENVRFQVASADRVPFETDWFDAVVSRFGIMFFPSPAECVRELLRVLKPNRPIVFAVWGYHERNPFHYVLAHIIDRYFPREPLPPDAPEPFRFAEPGKLLRVLNEAGASETIERLLQFNIEAPLAGEDFWALRLDMAEKLRGKLLSLPSEKAAEIKLEVLEALAPYSSASSVSFPAEVLIVSATKRAGNNL
jgi:SAM-dependent methyltransferase